MNLRKQLLGALMLVMTLGPGAAMAQSAGDYLSPDEQARIKSWLSTRRERQAVREHLASGQVDYRLTPNEMSRLNYLPNAVMEELELPLGYRDGSRLGFYGRNVVLIVPSSGQLIDVLPDAVGDELLLVSTKQ